MKTRKALTVILPALALAALVGLPTVGLAQAYDAVRLSTGFMPDPQVTNGRSGGGVDSATMGGGCRGFITPEPGHHMVLRTSFDWMRVFVRSEGDTTLIVRGPMPSMDTRCNDDRFGTNPAVEGRWEPGEYHIWVGSYSQDQSHRYEIGFTELTSVH